MEQILDSIQNARICINLRILSTILRHYPTVFEPAHYKQMLRMLEEQQPEAHSPIHAQAFVDIVDCMLKREAELIKLDPELCRELCSEQWHKIMQLALKNSSVNRATAHQNLRLLRLLIERNYIVSPAFLATVIKDITTGMIDRTDGAIELLIAMLKSSAGSAIEAADEHKISIIDWLHDNKTNSALDEPLAGELYAICCISKAESLQKRALDSQAIPAEMESDFLVAIKRLESTYQFQSLNKLVAVQEANESEDIDLVLPERSEVSINTRVYEALENRVFSHHLIRNVSFVQISADLRTLINILSQFLLYESFDNEAFEKSSLVKAIQFSVQRLNESLKEVPPSSSNVREMLNHLNGIWGVPLHPKVYELIFLDISLGHLGQWLKKCLSTKPKSDSDSPQLLSELKNENDRVQLQVLVLLARLSGLCNGSVAQEAQDALQDYEWNENCNEHVYILDKVIKTVLDSARNEIAIEFAFSHVKILCVKYFKHQLHAKMLFEYISGKT